jgi:hypothetical protein
MPDQTRGKHKGADNKKNRTHRTKQTRRNAKELPIKSTYSRGTEEMQNEDNTEAN